MNHLLKIIARNDGLRLALGGIASGGVIYGLVHPYPAIAWIAVPGAVVVGAISCFACEHVVESVVKAVLAAVVVFLTLRVIPRTMASDPAWWRLALAGLPLGFVGGMGVGSLLGGVCRLAWEPGIRDRDRDRDRGRGRDGD